MAGVLRSPKILAALAATWFVWGSTYLVIRFALVGFPPLFMMGTRFLVAGVLLLSLMRFTGSRWPTRREWGNALVIGTLMLGGGMGATAVAEMTVASGLVVSFIAVTPLLVTLASLKLGLRPAPLEWAGIALGVGGVWLLTQGEAYRASPAGLCAVITGCVTWTLGSVLSRRTFVLAPGPMGFASEMLCGGVVLLMLSVLFGEHPTVRVPTSAWLAWSYLVVFGSLVAFNAYMYLLDKVTPALSTSYTYVNPLIALLLGVTLGSEVVSPVEWVAVVVILAGLSLVLWSRR
jgi:drug/metabolite transporter (DMT)-like permease